MSGTSDKPQGGVEEATPPKIRAEDNPWYLLATLYGVPEALDVVLQAKNRIAWNRYFAANLDEETRKNLIEEKRFTAGELRLSPEGLRDIVMAFAERCKASSKEIELPARGAAIDFSNVEFEQRTLFSGYLFSSHANFTGATFSSVAYFNGATFSSGASFESATFSSGASLKDASFSGGASFYVATYFGTSFGGAIFSGVAIFEGATFSSEAIFGGATFSSGAFFEYATFSAWANFGATFGAATSFVNAEMNGETSFEGSKFLTEPPRFFGAKLHQGTVWPDPKQLPKPKNEEEAGRFIDAYACLKLEMDRLKKHEDELNFFALELQSRRVLLGTWKGLPIAIYDVLSDYGRSFVIPLVWLVVTGVLGTPVFRHFGGFSLTDAFGLSFANAFNVFGFRKDFFDASTIEGLPAALKILAAFQTIVGTILLFLFGLGVRNKFRMK